MWRQDELSFRYNCYRKKFWGFSRFLDLKSAMEQFELS